MTSLIKDALELQHNCPTKRQIKRVENRFTKLLNLNQANAPGKIPAFWKRLVKHKEKVFLFLQYPGMLPSHNNASELAIRNIKVKVKVSGQFRSDRGTSQYAVIISL